LRERNIVINSLLIPLLLYPLLLWLMLTAITFVQGQTEGHVARILVQHWPAGHAELRRALERQDRIRLLDPADVAARDPMRSLEDGTLDALIEFGPPDEKGAEIAGNFRVRVTFNESKERSVMARDRVGQVINRYREDWLEREAEGLGVDRGRWQVFALTTENVASDRAIGGFILGLMLPIFFVIAVAIGCFYPAVDATAGERERGTWETLMSTAADRGSVVLAKYLFVASMGCMAGILNLTALALTMRPLFGPILEQTGDGVTFLVGWTAIPVIGLGAVLLSGFVAAGMLLFAVFARTFKEGQSMITPFFMVIVLPVLFLQAPGLEFSPRLACVPVVNVVLMIRSALHGSFPWLPILLTVLVSMVLVALCVRLGAFILQSEEILLGSHRGGIRAFLSRLIPGRATTNSPLL
jgi:sodium transport system permease protein